MLLKPLHSWPCKIHFSLKSVNDQPASSLHHLRVSSLRLIDDIPTGQRGHPARQKYGKQKACKAQAHYGPHQPAQVVAHRAAERVQRVAHAAFEPTAAHSVVGLEVPDGRLNGLAALEPFALVFAHCFVAPPVNDFNTRVGRVHLFATVAQINNDLLGFDPNVFRARWCSARSVRPACGRPTDCRESSWRPPSALACE